MEEFFEKIKKKLSVDNILDMMKDGKLKEELKQTLTAKANLNENPIQQDGKSSEDNKNIGMDQKKQVTVENIQSKQTEEQRRVETTEKPKKDILVKPTSNEKIKLQDGMKETLDVRKQSIESIQSKPSGSVPAAQEDTAATATNHSNSNSESDPNIPKKQAESRRKFEEFLIWT